MKFVVITGLSGAGKSHALDTLEDLGFYCVDNMPAPLIPKFAELALSAGGQYKNVAIVADIRSGGDLNDTFISLKKILSGNAFYKVIFLDASDNAIVNRFKETRRKHPLIASSNDIFGAINLERERLDAVRGVADYIIDTSALHVSKLREYIINLFTEKETRPPIVISVTSFGFKYGIPTEADFLIDVRFLPNPYYNLNLRPMTGLDKAVRDNVFQSGDADKLMDKLQDLFEFLIPRYIAEGKNSLVIAIGCTGGKHRSVAIAEEAAAFLKKKDYFVTVNHRDLARYYKSTKTTE